MDAATAATHNGRLRQQLLTSDAALPDTRVGTHQQFYQMQLAGVDPSQRKASMTSQTTRKLFRRKRPDAFDDDTGADILDLTGANVSFDDLSHMRDRGPYGLGSSSLDSTPIIPTLSTASGRATSNIHYRKQMNHNMKLQLANGARAMSLAGANPMNNMGPNPRAMSLASGPRTMLLNPNMAAGVPYDPRAMSLNRTGPAPRMMSMKSSQMGPNPVPGPGAMPLGNQRAMSLSNQRAMSMGGQPMLLVPPQMNMHQMQQQQMIQQQQMVQQQQMWQQQQMIQQQMMHPHMAQPQMQQYHQPMQQPVNRMQPHPMQSVQHGRQSILPSHEQQQPYDQQQPHTSILDPKHILPPQAPAIVSNSSSVYEGSVPTSSDSLMNVPEEDEMSTKSVPQVLRGPEVDENEAIYKFDGEDDDNISVSRKSTLRKSNSMRLRKLNLFGKDAPRNIDEEDNSSSLPSPNVGDFSSDSKSASNSSPLRNQFGAESEGNVAEPKYLHKQKSLKSLTQNTAFHNFRSSSSLNRIRTGESGLEADMSVPKKDDQSRYEADEEEKTQSTINEKPSGLEAESVNEDPQTHDKDTHNQYKTFSDKSDLTASGEILNSTPPTTNTSNYSNSSTIQHDPIDHDEESDIFESSANTPKTPPALVQRNFSETRLLETPNLDRRTSRAFSITGKSKNIFKRLSKSSRRSSAAYDDETETLSKRNSVVSTISQRGSLSLQKQPLTFTKEELGIMNANNELLNELELVTTELASSIRRELSLENRLKNLNINSGNNVDLELEIRSKVKTISNLEEKLTKERRLRYISEEHALLLENGQSPSPMKLNYEKTELYRQLLVKNDLVNQLQDKLDEYQQKEMREDRQEEDGPSLLEKYNELLKENANLKFKVIPDMEKKLETQHEQGRGSLRLSESRHRQLSLTAFRDSNDDEDINQSHEIEMLTMKTQSDELREIIMKLNSSHNYEMKLASEKLKSYALKLNDQIALNEKLRQRLGANATVSPASSILYKGGKLNGLSIVSPNNTLFDD